MNERSSSTLSRLIAPLALAAAAVVLVIVVTSSLDLSGDGNGSVTPAPATEVDEQQLPADLPKRYEVKPGDSLSTIAEDTGVPVDVLAGLNPDIDPQALAPGDRVKLR